MTLEELIVKIDEARKDPRGTLNAELWNGFGFDAMEVLAEEERLCQEKDQLVALLEEEEYKKDEKSTAAKTRVRAKDLYKEYQNHKARVKRTEEYIRLLKGRAKIAQGGY